MYEFQQYRSYCAFAFTHEQQYDKQYTVVFTASIINYNGLLQ